MGHNYKKFKIRALGLLLPLVLLAGCATGTGSRESDRPARSNPEALETETAPIAKDKDRPECYAILDYFDALMLNDIFYGSRVEIDNPEEPLPPESLGEEIGRVGYTLADDACTDYVMKNGDATFLPAGTPIYAMRDYDSDFRVFAEGRIFQVNKNPHAKTIGDLYDIEGKVLKISRTSGQDGSHMWDFSAEDTENFISDMLSLKYVGFDEIYKNNPPENSIFLNIHLQDGTSFVTTYGPKANTLTTGAYGTERMRQIVLKRP